LKIITQPRGTVFACITRSARHHTALTPQNSFTQNSGQGRKRDGDFGNFHPPVLPGELRTTDQTIRHNTSGIILVAAPYQLIQPVFFYDHKMQKQSEATAHPLPLVPSGIVFIRHLIASKEMTV
jgi:hypothetical protein